MTTHSSLLQGHPYGRDARNMRLFAAWAVAAALSFLAATFLIGEQVIGLGAAAWLLTAITAATCVIALFRYVAFLRSADELLRKIHIEALALGFGAGALFMLVYRLCERLGAPKLDLNDPLLVMLLVWAGGLWQASRRYAAEDER